MIEITISGPRQSGRTTRAAQIAKALSDGGMRVAFTCPTVCLARWSSKALGRQCLSSGLVASGENSVGWDAVVVDDSELHDPEALRTIRHRLEKYPHSLLVLVKLEPRHD